jgi:hypothetical protein
MSRTVATARNSVSIVYFPVTYSEHSEEENEQNYVLFEFDELIEDVRNMVGEKYPSFQKCDKWLDREVHAILENDHAYITISEYCGLVSLCLVPKEESALSEPWCYKVAGSWSAWLNKKFGGLVKTGTASNGEAFFRRVQTIS